MRVRLTKLELIGEAELEALEKKDLVVLAKSWRQKLDELQTVVFRMRRHQFGQRSEKSGGSDATESPPPADMQQRGETTKLPSERYPDAQIREEPVAFEQLPTCPLCGAAMPDSGMTEDSEYIDVQHKEFSVVQQKRNKHRCAACHGAIATAPMQPRITPGGTYSDEMIVDATLSKYCDLIPMERYAQMAARGGFSGLPPHSLIKVSFRLADFIRPVYDLVKHDTLTSAVLLADETPHRMLEGDAKKRWYLWGFSNHSSSFFECHDTRSGDVSTAVLKDSCCDVLMTDAYSGYRRSINETNAIRAQQGIPPIQTAYCNAHARRQFLPSDVKIEDASGDEKFMVKQYKAIYKIEAAAKGLSEHEVLELRAQMQPYFEALKSEAESKIATYSDKSVMGKAYNYFLKYYDQLTLFLANAQVPIDNNSSERILRSSVIGRKTWYGTHSRAGAAAGAVHFSLVETCKMNRVNPRLYYLDAVDRIHRGRELVTPRQYKEIANVGNDTG